MFLLSVKLTSVLFSLVYHKTEYNPIAFMIISLQKTQLFTYGVLLYVLSAFSYAVLYFRHESLLACYRIDWYLTSDFYWFYIAGGQTLFSTPFSNGNCSLPLLSAVSAWDVGCLPFTRGNRFGWKTTRVRGVENEECGKRGVWKRSVWIRVKLWWWGLWKMMSVEDVEHGLYMIYIYITDIKSPAVNELNI